MNKVKFEAAFWAFLGCLVLSAGWVIFFKMPENWAASIGCGFMAWIFIWIGLVRQSDRANK